MCSYLTTKENFSYSRGQMPKLHSQVRRDRRVAITKWYDYASMLEMPCRSTIESQTNDNNNNNLLVHSNFIKLKWKFFLPNWSWARQPLSSARSTLLYPLLLNAKQGSSNSHLLTSFGRTRPGIEPTISRLWGGRCTDWANTPVSMSFK